MAHFLKNSVWLIRNKKYFTKNNACSTIIFHISVSCTLQTEPADAGRRGQLPVRDHLRGDGTLVQAHLSVTPNHSARGSRPAHLHQRHDGERNESEPERRRRPLHRRVPPGPQVQVWRRKTNSGSEKSLIIFPIVKILSVVNVTKLFYCFELNNNHCKYHKYFIKLYNNQLGRF